MNYLKSLNYIPVKLRNPEVINYRDRVIANGGIISEASIDAVTKFVQDCKNSQVWSKLLEVGPFAGSNLSAALVKLVYPAGSSSVLTNVNFVSGDYNETGSNGGLNGDGVTKYLNSGFNTQSLLPDNAHLSFYLRTDVSAAGNRSCIGTINGADQYWLGALTATTSVDARLGGNLTASLAQPLNKAFYIGSRAAANSMRLYKNGALSGSNSTTVTHNKPNLNLFLWAFNSAGAAAALLPARGSFYSIGSGLTDAEAAALYQAVQTLQRNLNREI
jgi:hypothetical protein